MPLEQAADNQDMAEHLLAFRESCEPIWDSGLGIRRQLQLDGWSEDAAEAMALQWVAIMMDTVRQSVMEGDDGGEDEDPGA
jgi:hypothetical protein